MFLLLGSTSAWGFEEESCELIKDKTCVDFGERMIDNFPITRCWKYETLYKCAGREENHCAVFESNRSCNELYGKCLESTVGGLCKDFDKRFACGQKLEERAETKLISTEYETKRDERDLSGCSKSQINKNCVIKEERCIEGPQTRNINGKNVHKECWKWDRKYYCKQDTYIDECKAFEGKCEEVSRKCLHGTGISGNNCEHYEVQYKCEEEQVEKVDCLATKFCIGGICDTHERHRHSDFAGSIAPFMGLMAMKNEEMEGCSCPAGKKDCSPADIDPQNCKVFKGGPERCKRVTGGYNCCSMKGFIKPIIGCSKSELDLQKKRDAGLCHHVGSWKGKGIELIVKKQGYCCFKSKLARLIQEGGREQLGIGWGDPRNPDCRALSVEEIQRIDFEKVDFSSLFAEVETSARNNFAGKAGAFEKNIKQFSSNQNAAAELLARKLKGFYKSEGGQDAKE
jgi:conjugal transfer mating pair stabilization protein TraN